MHAQHQQAVTTRLTALWALSESGLGGFMHALKIPFTGFFLGGFAILVITLIAYGSERKFQSIMRATLLVLLVKAAVSPHSPPQAYIAVAFQGLSGAVILGLLPFSRLLLALFGMIALFESAVQKFLVLTLLYGNTIWEALDLFFKSIARDLPGLSNASFSFWLISVYITVYTLWGLLLGAWAWNLPLLIHRHREDVLSRYGKLEPAQSVPGKKRGRRVARKLAGVFFMTLFIASVFAFTGEKGLAVHALLRTLAALLLLFFVLNPLVKWVMARWVEKRQSDRQFTAILNHLPQMRLYLAPALALAKESHTGLSVYKHFVINLLVLAIQAAPQPGSRENP